MQNPLDFSGRTVFVMGGTSGINLGVAEAFADCGATVGVASRSEDKVRAAVEKLSRPGRAAHGFAADVRDGEALQKGLDGIGSGWGRIDVLIAGQAKARGLTLVTSNLGEFQRVDGLRIEDWTRP